MHVLNIYLANRGRPFTAWFIYNFELAVRVDPALPSSSSVDPRSIAISSYRPSINLDSVCLGTDSESLSNPTCIPTRTLSNAPPLAPRAPLTSSCLRWSAISRWSRGTMTRASCWISRHSLHLPRSPSASSSEARRPAIDGVPRAPS